MKTPSLATLVKLGSLVVHVEEARSDDGHRFDWHAIDSLIADPEVKAWVAEMDAVGLMPRKRRPA